MAFMVNPSTHAPNSRSGKVLKVQGELALPMQHFGPHRYEGDRRTDLNPPTVLTLAEAAVLLRISAEHARKLALQGRLPGAFRLGRRHLVSHDGLQRFLATTGKVMS